MNTADIKRQMRSIAEHMLDTADGASWAPVVDAWKSTNADAIPEISTELFDGLVTRLAREVIKDISGTGNSQVPLPGFGDIDAYVTARTPEGGYLVKHVRHAVVADLMADAEIHEDNVRSALEARRRAKGRNRTLIPVMQEHECTAGEAMDWLETHG
jgi:hypothetical protein